MTTTTPTRQFALTAEQVARYREQGYLHLPGVFPPDEAAALRREAHELMVRLQRRQRIDATWGSARAVGMGTDTRLLHCHNVQFQSGAFTRLLTDPRLVDPVADLIGPNVQLHHTKLFIKPPEKGSPFPMHQDYPFFPHERHTMLAAIIHFDDAPLTKGCVRIVPGSHARGPMEHETEGSFHLPLSTYPIESATPVEAAAGDVLLFSYLTIHGSGVNESPEARTTLLVQMRAPDDPPTEQTHLSRGQGMMLRGVDPDGKATGGIES
jgi:ectoine hydroxylase-related dioxygenase (phytanoyl-CoA dioxygenase family)